MIGLANISKIISQANQKMQAAATIKELQAKISFLKSSLPKLKSSQKKKVQQQISEIKSLIASRQQRNRQNRSKQKQVKTEKSNGGANIFLPVLPKKRSKNKQVVICLDDQSEVAQCSAPTKKQKNNEYITDQIIFTNEEVIHIDQQPIQQQKPLNGINISTKVNQDFHPDQLRVVRLNHFFKWEGKIYFEAMVGRGQDIFREPQLISFETLQTNENTKVMLYLYLKQKCMRVAAMEQLKQAENKQ